MKNLRLLLCLVVVVALVCCVDSWLMRRRRRNRRGGGCTIILYEHGNFGGRKLVLHSAVPNLRRYHFQDKVSSAKVLSCRWRVYEHPNYRGKSGVIGPGSYRTWHRFRMGNDRMSSVRAYGGRSRVKKRGQCGCGGCRGSYGVCSGSGDPHFRSFDRKMIHFMGICTYTLAKPCAGDDFHVMYKGERRYRNHKVAYTRHLLVKLGATVIKLDKRRLVYVNDERVNLPFTKANFTVSLSGRNVMVCTKTGIRVSFDGRHRSEVRVPNKYKGKMCGLCGNWNGNGRDDMKDANGRLQRSYAAVGNSWIAQGFDKSCPSAKPMPKGRLFCKNRRVARSCRKLTGGPFKSCQRAIHPRAYLKNCQIDLCSLRGRPRPKHKVTTSKKVFCRSMQAYADDCAAKGVKVNWRTFAGCPLPCPANSRYSPCASGCPNTCTNPNAERPCNIPCSEGCSCRPDFVLSGDVCVPKTQCGCTQDGRYRTLGETWTDKKCMSQYTCKPKNKVVTVKMGCGKANTVCKLSLGFWGCYCAPGFRPLKGQCQSICPPLCRRACPNGFVKDPKGCSICQCKQPPKPRCPPLCRMFCPNGFVKNANGCPICKCKTPPKPRCGPVCSMYCKHGKVEDANGCPTCKCRQPPTQPVEKSGGSTSTTTTTEVTGGCPTGTVLEGKECIEWVCPKGSTLVGKECIIYEGCPKGYTLQGEECVENDPESPVTTETVTDLPGETVVTEE